MASMAEGPATMLLVEDSADDILLIRRALTRAKIANPLEVVTDGEAAVDYLGGTGAYADRDRYPLPAVVLLDLKLPRRSGLEVLRWVRSAPGVKRVPVVVLTSSSDGAEVRAAYDYGANSYLVKPVRFDALQDLMRYVHHYWTALNHRAPPDGG